MESSDSNLRPVEAIAINTNIIMTSIYVIVVQHRDTQEVITLRLKGSGYENI